MDPLAECDILNAEALFEEREAYYHEDDKVVHRNPSRIMYAVDSDEKGAVLEPDPLDVPDFGMPPWIPSLPTILS